MSTLECAVEKQNSYIRCPRKTLEILSKKKHVILLQFQWILNQIMWTNGGTSLFINLGNAAAE